MVDLSIGGIVDGRLGQYISMAQTLTDFDVELLFDTCVLGR